MLTYLTSWSRAVRWSDLTPSRDASDHRDLQLLPEREDVGVVVGGLHDLELPRDLSVAPRLQSHIRDKQVVGAHPQSLPRDVVVAQVPPERMTEALRHARQEQDREALGAVLTDLLQDLLVDRLRHRLLVELIEVLDLALHQVADGVDVDQRTLDVDHRGLAALVPGQDLRLGVEGRQRVRLHRELRLRSEASGRVGTDGDLASGHAQPHVFQLGVVCLHGSHSSSFPSVCPSYPVEGGAVHKQTAPGHQRLRFTSQRISPMTNSAIPMPRMNGERPLTW